MTMTELHWPYRIRSLIPIVIIAMSAIPSANAEHNGGSDTTDTAYYSANCSASFKGCPDEGLSSTGYAAPWPHLGGGPEDIGLLVLMLCALLFGRRLGRKTRVE